MWKTDFTHQVKGDQYPNDHPECDKNFALHESPLFYEVGIGKKILIAMANSRKPRTTFTVPSQPPDFGQGSQPSGEQSKQRKWQSQSKPKSTHAKTELNSSAMIG